MRINYIIGHIVGIVALTAIMVNNTISNDSIVLDSETENAVNIEYWRQQNRKEEQEEMIPIIEWGRDIPARGTTELSDIKCSDNGQLD